MLGSIRMGMHGLQKRESNSAGFSKRYTWSAAIQVGRVKAGFLSALAIRALRRAN